MNKQWNGTNRSITEIFFSLGEIMLNISDPNVSYLIGLLQADGHIGHGKGQKGKLSYEMIILAVVKKFRRN
jgi:hypothetical protein